MGLFSIPPHQRNCIKHKAGNRRCPTTLNTALSLLPRRRFLEESKGGRMFFHFLQVPARKSEQKEQQGKQPGRGRGSRRGCCPISSGEYVQPKLAGHSPLQTKWPQMQQSVSIRSDKVCTRACFCRNYIPPVTLLVLPVEEHSGKSFYTAKTDRMKGSL